jgi:F420-dependent oxidoreductase-like protein
MVEGQEAVTWEQWLALARACEEHGLEGLFRSDHYASVMQGQVRGGLDAWATLTALAAHTERIRLGSLVSPVTFRHPSELAKVVVTADHVSGGRVELGMGAGWNEHEHRSYGFPFHDMATRLERFAEALEIVHGQWTEEAFDFEGRHYRLEECRALPKPLQEPHPPLIVGGSAGRKTADPAARWADEYNTVAAPVEACRERRAKLDAACERAGRDPATLVFSLMTGCVVGEDESQVRERVEAVLRATGRDGELTPEEYLETRRHALVLGTVEEAAARLRELEEAGVERIFLQHLAHDDVEMVELIGRELVPRVG